MHLEAEKDDEISCWDIVEKETSEKQDNCDIGMETLISKISTGESTGNTENQKEDIASLRKRSIAKVDGSPEITGKVGVKKPRRIPPGDVSVGGLPIAGNDMDPNDDNDENKKWFSEVTSLLRSKANATALVNAQIDFTIVDGYGHGYLHYAVEGGNWSPKMLQFLIDKGAPVTTSRLNCETLLHIAARNRAPWETFEFLLDKGIELGQKNCIGYTALDLVIQNSHETKEGVITKLLIKAFNAGIRYSRYLSKQCPMLHLGIKYGTLEVVKHMLENGAAVNEVDSKGKPSFFMAIEEHTPDNVEKAKLLRRFDAVISLEVEERKKYLHVMAKAGMDPEVLKYCIDEFEVDADATLANGKTLLHSILSASRFSNSMFSIVKTLILEGANVNAKPEARIFADEIKKLQSPLHLLLCRYDAKIDALSFVDILIRLLDRGANINEKSLEGWTALHILMDNCSRDSLELAKLLVQFGADIHAETRKRQSVLHIAAGKKDIEKIQFCLSEGLDVNALDSCGRTPVEYFFLPGNRTCGYSNERACQMANGMKVLLDNGATAKTKADVKKKIQILLKSAWGNRSGVKVVLEKFLSLLK